MKRGIIQSRGLGDIVIALPIAHYYHQQGDEIVWPICREFLPSFEKSVPWVQWVGIDTDQQGRFFLETPLQVLKEQGVAEDFQLYLYQYLSNMPELTDPELFSILKFDQYKYWVSGVPFRNKWELRNCITRDAQGEERLLKRLELVPGEPYAVAHLKGSSFEARVDVTWLDPAVRIINVDEYITDSIWDWLGVLEGATAFVGIDSVMANLVDSWGFPDLDLYWLRRSAWDLTPVLGSAWCLVPTNLEIVRDFRVDPAQQAREKLAAQSRPRGDASGGLTAYSPFQAQGAIPTSFMHALKK